MRTAKIVDFYILTCKRFLRIDLEIYKVSQKEILITATITSSNSHFFWGHLVHIQILFE